MKTYNQLLHSTCDFVAGFMRGPTLLGSKLSGRSFNRACPTVPSGLGNFVCVAEYSGGNGLSDIASSCGNFPPECLSSNGTVGGSALPSRVMVGVPIEDTGVSMYEGTLLSLFVTVLVEETVTGGAVVDTGGGLTDGVSLLLAVLELAVVASSGKDTHTSITNTCTVYIVTQ